MARAIWKGVISFGMVSIPIRLYSATSDRDIRFNQIHDACKTRIREKRWCPHCDREIDYEEVKRGYEFSKNRYIMLDDEDFEKLPLASRHRIEVNAFVDRNEIDPVYFEKSYYLEPDEAAIRPYSLFLTALAQKNLVAVAKIALRNKERLCVLRPYGGLIMLDTLLYPDEIRVKPDQSVAEIDLNKRELDMAHHLVELMTQPFEPENYQDNYRIALRELIEAKLAGEEIAVPQAPKAKVMDLMEALRASVEQVQGNERKTAQKGTPKRRRRTSAATRAAAEEVAKEERSTARKRKPAGSARRGTTKGASARRRAAATEKSRTA